MIQKIINAKKDTFVRVNNVVYAKISDAEDSAWRSAFGIKYANAFINMCRQAKNVEFLDEPKVEQPRKVKSKLRDVREEEPSQD